LHAQHVELKLFSRLDDGNLCGELMRCTCQYRGFAEEDIAALELCTLEAFNNAAEHAHGLDDSKPIRVTITCLDDEVCVCVFDTGPGMALDLLNGAMPPTDPDNPETWTERGRGLPIIRELMTRVSYETSDGVNVLKFSRSINRTEVNRP
jgi:anti-sigma regulatory factor (Ser/Thr protein kinase)